MTTEDTANDKTRVEVQKITKDIYTQLEILMYTEFCLCPGTHCGSTFEIEGGGRGEGGGGYLFCGLDHSGSRPLIL